LGCKLVKIKKDLEPLPLDGLRHLLSLVTEPPLIKLDGKRVDILELNFTVLVAKVLHKLVEIIIEFGVKLFHLLRIGCVGFLGLLQDILIDRVLEIGAQVESQTIKVLCLVIVKELKDRDHTHFFQGIALGYPDIDYGVQIVRIGLHVGLLAEAILILCRFS
jgi:hypothetical protein